MKLGLLHFNHVLTDGTVHWHSMRLGKPRNYGDALVCAALVRQLGLGDGPRAMFGRVVDGEPADAWVLRGSTYLHREFDFESANRTLDSIDAPIVAVGLGAQHQDLDPAFLDGHEGAAGFIRRLAEKSTSISVRGEFTADVVRRLGADRVRVTGCPSLFYGLATPRIRLSSRLGTGSERAAISIHSGLNTGRFCRDAAAARGMHGRLIEWMFGNCAGGSIFEQGVLSEFAIGDPLEDMDRRMEEAAAFCARVGLDAARAGEVMAAFVHYTNVDEWIERMSTVDFAAGFRFHGNMAGLLQGIPCMYFCYDARLEEFCRLYGLPFRRIEDGFVDPVEAILSHDWKEAERRFAMCKAELTAFYAENGLTHAIAD